MFRISSPSRSARPDPDFATRYNAFFSLPSDDFDLECCERVRAIDHLDQDTVEHYREHAAATGRPVLLQALSGYGYIDQHPEAYQALCAVSPYRGYRAAGPVPSTTVSLGYTIGLLKGLDFRDVHEQTPEAMSLVRLRLSIDPPSQILQTNGCLCHLTPTSP